MSQHEACTYCSLRPTWPEFIKLSGQMYRIFVCATCRKDKPKERPTGKLEKLK